MKSLVKHHNRRFRSFRWLLLVAVVGMLLLFAPRLGRSDSFVFYFPKSRSILQTRTYGNAQYLPVLPVLNLFGTIEDLKNRRKALELRFNGTHIRLQDNNPTVRLNNARVKLAQPVRFMDGAWMAPVDFVTTVLPTIINQTVEYKRGENRIFVGGMRPNSFTLHLSPLQAGAQLTIQFTEQVNLRTAAQNGKWILYLGNNPVEPVESSFDFSNPYVSQVKFDDHDGLPKLIVTPSAAGFDFYPKLGEGGKVLIATVIKPGATVAQQAPAPSQPPVAAAPVPGKPPAAVPPQAGGPAVAPAIPSLPAVVLDAGHGGSDLGAQGKDGMLEKNLTARLAAQAQKALQATGKYRVVLTRTSDVNVGFDQRAAEANIAHPVAFISFHAGELGQSTPRVMVYSYRPSSPLAMTTGPDPQPLFINWDKVQLRYMNQSNRLAQELQQDLERTTKVASTPPMEVPMRVLQSIAAPAVAIEVGSLSPQSDSAALTNPAFQQQISEAIVAAVGAITGGRQ
ncbi:MAG TPA: N-acetylmuramoyl-L-alanine amidase [Terriglobia bacterium]|nr:N-acetylmuramoyl-L-alanine amidase [Terriglobia bacterium]